MGCACRVGCLGHHHHQQALVAPAQVALGPLAALEQHLGLCLWVHRQVDHREVRAPQRVAWQCTSSPTAALWSSTVNGLADLSMPAAVTVLLISAAVGRIKHLVVVLLILQTRVAAAYKHNMVWVLRCCLLATVRCRLPAWPTSSRWAPWSTRSTHARCHARRHAATICRWGIAAAYAQQLVKGLPHKQLSSCAVHTL